MFFSFYDCNIGPSHYDVDTIIAQFSTKSRFKDFLKKSYYTREHSILMLYWLHSSLIPKIEKERVAFIYLY